MAKIAVRAALAFAPMLMLAMPAPASALSSTAAGLLGSLAPGLANTGINNAAGVLSYCMKNQLLNGTNAASILGRLTGRPGVKTSNDFLLGQKGTLQTDDMNLSLNGVKGQLKNRLCGLVLNHAQSLIPNPLTGQ